MEDRLGLGVLTLNCPETRIQAKLLPSCTLFFYHDSTMQQRSYGIIPLKRYKGGFRLLLLRHGGGHWAFPKGRPEKGERPEETAVRELKEEAGLEIREFLPIPPLTERYIFTWKGEKVFKEVTFFVAFVKGKVNLQEEEVTASQWVALEKAEEKVTFPEGKRLCQELAALILAFSSSKCS